MLDCLVLKQLVTSKIMTMEKGKEKCRPSVLSKEPDTIAFNSSNFKSEQFIRGNPFSVVRFT